MDLSLPLKNQLFQDFNKAFSYFKHTVGKSDDLKNKIQKLTRDSLKRKEWEEKREDLLAKMEALEDSLKNRYYQKKPLDAKDDLLKNMKRKLKEIDAFLDDLEEDEDIEHLQEELLKERIRENPEKKEAYENAFLKKSLLKADLEKEKSKQHFLETLKTLLLSLEEVYLKVKSLFIFAYILGPNPNYQITHILSAITQLIEKNPDLSPSSLEELKNHAVKPWSLASTASLIETNKPIIEAEIDLVKESITKIENQIEKA